MQPPDAPPDGAATRRGALREVAALAAPVVLQQVSATTMMVVDSAMVGRLGATELAAVGFGGVWLWTVFSLFYGTASGVQTFVSQHDGAGQPEECGTWAWQGLYTLVPATLALVLLAAPWVESLLQLLGPSEAMAEAASSYIATRLPGEVMMAVLMIFTSFFRGIGDTVTPMAVTVGANLLNAVLDYGLIFGRLGLPEWGVAGAGAATALSTAAAACVILLFFARRSHRDRYRTRPAPPDAWRMGRLLRVGAPIGGQWCIGMTSFAFFTTLVARMGDTSMAASQAFVMLLNISFMQAVGVSIATQTLVGRYVGARDEPAVQRSFRAALGLGIGMALLVSVLFLTVPAGLMRIFTDDASVLALGRPLLAIGAVFLLFDAITVIAQGALRGAGDTRWPFVVETAFGWGFFVPLAYTLGVTLEYGLAGAWLGGLVSLGITAGVLTQRFRSGAWRRLRI